MEQQGKPLPEEELKNIELRTELFNRYILPNKNLVYRLCIRYTYLQENIADNYSEALVNFFKYITTYDPQRSILNWIHIVTKRFVMEQNRRHGRLPVSENVNVYSLASSLSDEDDTHGNAMGMENYREFYNDDILNALDSLKPIYREALLLQQAGYKLEEIVEISYRNGNMKSRSLDTMKSRIFLAKQQMRNSLRPMERNDKTRVTVSLFETLVRRLIDASFRFPGGESGRRTVAACLEMLRTRCGGELSDERIADFCICQVHAISRFDGNYLSCRWMPSHSFGPKARERFAATTPVRRYHEDRWLQEAGLSRTALPLLLKDRREHPLWQFLDPAYEEATKQRVVNTPVGYYVCGISTLLWNPFSAACRTCSRADLCRKRTAARYPELYRLRREEAERRNRP